MYVYVCHHINLCEIICVINKILIIRKTHLKPNSNNNNINKITVNTWWQHFFYYRLVFIYLTSFRSIWHENKIKQIQIQQHWHWHQYHKTLYLNRTIYKIKTTKTTKTNRNMFETKPNILKPSNITVPEYTMTI